MESGNITDVFGAVKGFDFNLLTMFEAVYTYGSVTLAAQALDLSPSSVSQSLQKLRLHFGDPLFVREGKSLSATTVAMSLHQALTPSFDNFLFAFQKISAQSSYNSLVINCSTYLSTIIIPVITKIVSEIMPECKIVHAVNDSVANSAEEALIYRRADIIFDSNPHYGISFISKKIFEEEIVLICNQNHPRLQDTLTIEQAKNEEFVVLETDSEIIKEFQATADSHFGERNIKLRTPSLLCVLAATEHSELIGSIPYWLFEKMKNNFNIKKLKPEFEIKSVPIYMIYNKSSINHPSLNKIINQINHYQAGWNTL